MSEQEVFVISHSFGIPFSEESTQYLKGLSAYTAFFRYCQKYDSFWGPFAANCYLSADDYHKKKEPIMVYRHSKAIEQSGMPKKFTEAKRIQHYDDSYGILFVI